MILKYKYLETKGFSFLETANNQFEPNFVQTMKKKSFDF
jgi:hypothetical protein